MVLARRHAPLDVLHGELRRLGIASEHTEKQTLAAQAAVQDVLALLDALLSPGHDLALAQALKSPLIGWGDEELMALARAAQSSENTKTRQPWLHALETAPIESAAALHERLMRWRSLLLTLPPHDALQAILAERDRAGMDAIERFAAAAPASERAARAAHLRALLAHALQAQGGRHLNAWQWLRELRRAPPPAPSVAQAGAVRLLTVHGAKGLEAAEVLLLSSASKPRSGEGDAATLMDWPATATAPQRLAFVASGKQCPPSLDALWAQEQAAQAREELNILYVAATRAARSLTLSGVEPSTLRGMDGTWWQRLEAHFGAPFEPDDPALHAAHTAAATFPAQRLPAIALPEVPEDAPEKTAGSTSDSDDSRIGQAMHWLLENAGSAAAWSDAQLAQAQRRFALDDAQRERAHALAQRIRHGAGAWAWDDAQLEQAYNEVELAHDGALLRLDRLVQRKDGAGGGAWWVLDYKSAHRPEQQDALNAQLARYRAAVRALHPGSEVRAAFLSGDGRMVEVAE